MTIDPATRMGAVTLTVADLDALAAFYRHTIGLEEQRREGVTVELGAPGSAEPLVRLVGDPAAPPRPNRTTGLFHLAVLVPSRAELARALNRVQAAGWRFTGASDHLVSEALYLDDPEGNGIEIYRDRPREEWSRDADGNLRMATLPMDVEGVLGSAEPGDAGVGMPEGTTIGHVHLQVRSIPEADDFYTGALGFDATVRGYPGALFVSAGGYHHHLGLNTWAGEGAPPPPPGARGLRSYEIVLAGRAGARRREGGRRGSRGRDERRQRRASQSSTRPATAPCCAAPSTRHRGCRARLALVLVRRVAGAEVAQRHPDRAVLHLPDVAELMHDEVVRHALRAQQHPDVKREAVEARVVRQPKEPRCHEEPNVVDPHRVGPPVEAVEALLRSDEPRVRLSTQAPRTTGL